MAARPVGGCAGVQAAVASKTSHLSTSFVDDPGVRLLEDAHHVLVANPRHGHQRSGDLGHLENAAHQEAKESLKSLSQYQIKK